MVGLRLLGMMDQRCRQAKDNDEILGNLCVVMLGDIHQLGPIFDNPLYTQQLNVGSNSFSQRGKLVSMSFEICFCLCTAMRFDNHDYIQFLDRVSCGMCTKADVKMLKKRSILNLKEVERLQFKNCLRICAKKDASHECNTSNLKNLGSPIARIAAENNSEKAFSCTDDMANGLSNVLYLALNSRIMLRKNLNVSMGLVNGALGTIKDIIYAKGCRPPQLPLFVIVQFDDHDGFDSSWMPLCRPSLT
ncbi:ATP-dependent DNA helicase [Frankliniella fusca]|uniref:ATP-dependent DNA helicase n=1 Tax=Frankliniella fusca TaxID=407009 RepID=A0AAE1LV90_9NEOP|nr:ATP-dependent DNA helicase [Frankliniella fusca]